jgi:hypothetical protein
MGEESTEKEQTQGSSGEEKTEKSSEIGGFRDAVAKYSESLKENQTGEENKAGAGEEETGTCEECTATEEDLKVEDEAGKKALKPTLFISDEKGKILGPLIGKARGKEYIPDSIEKAQAWVNLGIVQDEERAITNKERAEMAKVMPLAKLITQAYGDGRLVIKDDKGQGEKTKEEETQEEEETEYVDPKVKALTDRVKELESKLNKSDENRKKEKQSQFEAFVEEHRSNMKKDMEGLRKKAYFGADIYLDKKPEDFPKNVWDLMGEVDENGNPKYSLEQAMKISHESQVNYSEKFLIDHPECFPKLRDKIVGQYNKEKNEREKAPEGPPGERPEIPKKEKRNITGVQDAIEQFNVYFKEKEKAGAAH